MDYIKVNPTTSNITIRNNLSIKNDDLEYKWMEQVPFDTRQEAIKNLTSSYKAAIALKKKGYIKKFEFSYLAKKDKNDVCYVNKNALKNMKIFQRKLNKSKLKVRKRAKKQFTNSDGNFLCLIKKYNNVSKNINSTDEIVALDPGVRTFQTYFSQNECGTIGDNANIKIRKINEKIDKLEGLKASSKAKTKVNLNRRCLLLRSKITNKVNDLHWKTASFLTRRYKVIFLPNFRVKQMCMKSPNKKTNREMCNLAHYKFKERIKYKAQLNNCIVIDCCESFTSKTCTKCGVFNNVGSKKIYKCETCNSEIDRDLNGARNIFIRCLTKYYTGSDVTR